IKQSQYREKDVIGDNVNFLKHMRADYPTYRDKIYIGGILGCKGDAYNGKDALSEEEAYKYHSWQAQAFKEAGVDFVFACIMPALTEAIGMARAMEKSEPPYIISFMIRKDGKLLDGAFIHDAIVSIDEAVERKPEGYVVNCVHPKVLKQALEVGENQTDVVRRRFMGIQANASSMSPEELNQSAVVHEESLEELIDGMIELYDKYGFKILGGCCGTTDEHIRALAERMRGE
ncbi:MAG: homocysteine S-methyltransferase family protein, partial [Cellulosilyticaceae bacterium]